MELNEAARRIFLQHWWLIAVGVIVGVALGVVVAGRSGSYTASTRMVIDSQDPKARAESTAIADTVRAIATSPALVQKALATAGAASSRDATSFGADHVSVTALGTSGVLSLSVTDSSRAVAASVANALANEVIETRLTIAEGRLEADQAKLTSRIDTLSKSIAALNASIGDVTRSLLGASAARQTVLQVRLGNLSRQRDFLTQQRGILQSEQASLLATTNGRPTPTIISPASAANAVLGGSSFAPTSVLAGLLGLVAALVIVAVLEAVRPTLAGGESVARELGKPHLGAFSVDGSGQLGAMNGADITYPLREAARRAGVANIDLLGIGSTVDLALIAAALDSAVAAPGAQGANGAGTALPTGDNGAFTIRPFGPREVAEGKGTGLVVIAPAILKKSALDEAMQFLRTTPWPLLGVMTYKPTRHHRWGSIFPGRSTTAEKTEAPQVEGKDKEVIGRR